MKRQMAKIINNGTWRVIHDDTKTYNQYRITKNGRKVEDYADLASCLARIAEEMNKTKKPGMDRKTIHDTIKKLEKELQAETKDEKRRTFLKATINRHSMMLGIEAPYKW